MADGSHEVTDGRSGGWQTWWLQTGEVGRHKPNVFDSSI